MKFFRLLSAKSPWFFIGLVFFALLNSIWTTSLLSFIEHKINGEDFPIELLNDNQQYIFVVLILISFFFAKAFHSYMIKLTYNLGNDLGLSLLDKLRFVEYEDYEKIGQEKIRTVLDDVETLQEFPETFITVVEAGIMVIVGVGYMFYLDIYASMVLLFILVFLTVIITIRNKVIEEKVEEVRDMEEVDEQNVDDLIRGFKELKTSIDRNDNLYVGGLSRIRNKIKDLHVFVIQRDLVNRLIGMHSWNIVVGIILFVLPLFMTLNTALIANFIVIIFFLASPVSAFLSEIYEFIQMNTAYKRIVKFLNKIEKSKGVKTRYGDLETLKDASFEEMKFKNVEFQYKDKDGKGTFKIDPLNFILKRGECVFITGGNGSGKSTFINLLTGLYKPTSGNIFFNDVKISKNKYVSFRDKITSVFTDVYLFDKNYNDYKIDLEDPFLKNLIEKMQLNDVLKLNTEDNNFEHNLSKGQQKRLALIYALLEKKDILVLDEWAAEQDPIFREYFYKELIPDLVNQGKTLIVVSHDDKYFDCGTRLVQFEYGNIASDKKIGEIPILEPNL